jgi:hypothetical protein
MAYWKTTPDEREDKRFVNAGSVARLLYADAGAWCMQEVHRKRVELPDEWFVPADLVRGWGKKNAAAALVREGLWERFRHGGRAGFIYAWIVYENTPGYIRNQREQYQKDYNRRQRAKQRRGGGENSGTTWR